MKKSIKTLQEKIKKIQSQMKEVEKAFLMEIGATTLKWLQGTKDIAELEEKITQIKKKFGKE